MHTSLHHADGHWAAIERRIDEINEAHERQESDLRLSMRISEPIPGGRTWRFYTLRLEGTFAGTPGWIDFPLGQWNQAITSLDLLFKYLTRDEIALTLREAANVK